MQIPVSPPHSLHSHSHCSGQWLHLPGSGQFHLSLTHLCDLWLIQNATPIYFFKWDWTIMHLFKNHPENKALPPLKEPCNLPSSNLSHFSAHSCVHTTLCYSSLYLINTSCSSQFQDLYFLFGLKVFCHLTLTWLSPHYSKLTSKVAVPCLTTTI